MTEPVETVAVSEEITLKEFFENTPPGKAVKIKNISKRQNSNNYLNLTAIELHCETNECNGVRFFNPQDVHIGGINAYKEVFLTFICRNCNKGSKKYAFLVELGESASDNSLLKLGEIPPFGPPTPARVMSLIGEEREYYLKGRRAENQNLGIAAFAYYRRVVENQKTRIIDEIIRVGKKVGASEEILNDLDKARHETQFSSRLTHLLDPDCPVRGRGDFRHRTKGNRPGRRDDSRLRSRPRQNQASSANGIDQNEGGRTRR